MSRQATKRANAINSEFDSVTKESASVVSKPVSQTPLVKLFVVFLHENLLNNKTDMSEGDRVDLRDALVPLRPQIQDSLAEIDALFAIHDDDLSEWQANFNTYLAANPTVLDEALNRFPKVD